MGKMKDIAMTLQEIPTMMLMQALKERLNPNNEPLMVTNDELNSLATSIEVVLMERYYNANHFAFED